MNLEDIEIVKKASYSEGFKEQALSKVFSRGDRTVQAVADELNISLHTLKNWMTKALPELENKTNRKAKRPGDWSLEERLHALHESHGLSGDALNAWCREHGLFAHQLAEWKADFCATSKPMDRREEASEMRALKAENQRLERELNRKEKALAEAAALLVLQKKYQALLGGEVE
jgi:transposase-like protein